MVLSCAACRRDDKESEEANANQALVETRSYAPPPKPIEINPKNYEDFVKLLLNNSNDPNSSNGGYINIGG